MYTGTVTQVIEMTLSLAMRGPCTILSIAHRAIAGRLASTTAAATESSQSARPGDEIPGLILSVPRTNEERQNFCIQLVRKSCSTRLSREPTCC